MLIQGILVDTCVRVKDLGLDFPAGHGPIADDIAVQEDDGPEDAGAVVGAVGVDRVQSDLTALVADEVFVVGWQQGYCAAAESASAGILVYVEYESFPMLFDEFALDSFHSGLAVADVHSGPPHEVL